MKGICDSRQMHSCDNSQTKKAFKAEVVAGPQHGFWISRGSVNTVV